MKDSSCENLKIQQKWKKDKSAIKTWHTVFRRVWLHVSDRINWSSVPYITQIAGVMQWHMNVRYCCSVWLWDTILQLSLQSDTKKVTFVDMPLHYFCHFVFYYTRQNGLMMDGFNSKNVAEAYERENKLCFDWWLIFFFYIEFIT